MRYIQFDAMRGMAALSVVLSHFIGMIPNMPDWFTYFEKSPIHIFWDGAAAVNLFFVLSGFCVAMPYMRSTSPRPIAWSSFIVRRFFRLYPAYIVALLLCIVAKAFYVSPAEGQITAWGMEFWQWESLSFSQLLTLAGMIYHADTKLLDPPTWSLVVEMKMALILPVMFWAYRRWGLKGKTVLTMGLIALMLLRWTYLNYACHFAFGIMIAKERDYFMEKIASLSKSKMLALLGLGLLLYTCRWPWKGILASCLGNSYQLSMLFEIINGFGSAFLIIAFFHPSIAKRLSNDMGRFLGEISYSIYLVHFPVLLLCVSYFSNWYASILVLLSVSILLSVGMYRHIERPLIEFGRKLSGGM